MNNFLKNVTEQLNQKLKAQATVKRSDITMVDYVPVDETTVKATFAYDTSEGVPAGDDISQYVVNYLGNYKPIYATFRADKQSGVFSIAISAVTETRRYDDYKEMNVVVGNLYYVDADMGDLWEVTTSAEGQKYLVRKSNTDLTKVFNDRLSRIQAQSGNVNLNIYQNRASASLLTPNINKLGVGDLISFFYNGAIAKGEIVNIANETITVKPEGTNGPIDINVHAVVNLIQHNTSYEQNTDEYLKEYYTVAYGDPDYAKKVVEGSVNNPYKKKDNIATTANSLQQAPITTTPMPSMPDNIYYSGNPMAPMTPARPTPQLVIPPPATVAPVANPGGIPVVYNTTPQQPYVMPESQPVPVQPNDMQAQPMQREFLVGDTVIFRGHEGNIIEISKALNKALVDFNGEYTNWIDMSVLTAKIDQEIENVENAPATVTETEEIKTPEGEEEITLTETSENPEDMENLEGEGETEEPEISEDEDFSFSFEEEEPAKSKRSTATQKKR